MRNESKTAQMFVVGLLLAAMILYFPPYAWAWVGDDYVQFDYVLEFLKRPLSAVQLFNPYFLPWYYRPLQNLWFLGNRVVFDLNPVPFYWQMVLWHSLATTLVYRVLRQFGVRPFSALLATALFAIHGHYVDVVGWNSSMAIVMAAVFSLASLSFYLQFLTAENAEKNRSLDSQQSSPIFISTPKGEKLIPLAPGWIRRGKRRNKKFNYLGLSFLFFVLAVLTHEEAILLPLFLVIMTFFKRQKAEGRNFIVTPAQVLALVGMLGVTAVSIFIQFNRPNLTIDISETPSTQWLELVSPLQIGQFVKDISLRYTLTVNWSIAQDTTPLLLAISVLLLLGAWFLMGSWTVRLGLIWVALHLGLIYATLWHAKPNLLAGRHFYQASFGLVLAIGATADQLRQIESPQIKVGRWRVSLVKALVVGVIMGTLISHINTIQATQQKWLDRAEIDQAARKQMKLLLPEIGEDTRVFANRFPISPAFFRSVTEIWYELDTPLPQPTGSFTQLQEHGRATADFYVFDYEDGTLYNLMPELQAADKTVFLWSQEFQLDVVDNNGKTLEIETKKGEHGFAVIDVGENGRFAVRLAPVEVVDGWLSLAYVMPEVPADSILHVSMRTDAASGAPARVRLELASGKTITPFDEIITSDWTDLVKPMGEFAGQTMVIRLETAVAPGGTVYWGNPRFVVSE